MAREIVKHVERTEFKSVSSTATAISAIAKDKPHVVISTIKSSNIDGYEILEYLRGHSKAKNVPLILVGEIPSTESYVDELVSGKVQFSDDTANERKFSSCLKRALNFVTHNDDEPVNLVFLDPDDYLFRSGENAKFVYVVKAGSLEASVVRNGRKVVLGTIAAGEFVGEMAYINGEPRSADVVAISDCELIEIPIDMFDEVLLAKPSWSKALMQTLSHRMSVANAKIN